MTASSVTSSSGAAGTHALLQQTSSPLQFSTIPKCTLHEDFSRLLKAPHFCDITFVIGEEESELNAHSALVAARSVVLRERILAAEPCAVSGMKKLPLPNTTLQATKFLLMYLYGDAIDPVLNGEERIAVSVVVSIIDVYHLSCQLKMKRLESLCLSYLYDHICRTNVLSALMYSAERQLMDIKEYCIATLVGSHYMEEIVMSLDFERLSQPLLIEVIRAKYNRESCQAHLNTSGSEQSFTRPRYNMDQGLVEDMQAFLEGKGQTLCDVTLVLGSDKIPAHRAILAARCRYFEALFRNFPPSDNTVNISIGDTVPSRQAFDSLLRYIYYGDVSMPTEDSLYLFPAPHFYGFTNNRLQAYCKQNLELKVTTENVIQVLETAHKIGANDMKQHALSLITPRLAKVVKTAQFRRLDKELLLEVIDALAQGGRVDTSVDITTDELPELSSSNSP